MAWSRSAGTKGLPQLTEEEKKLRGQSPYQGAGRVRQGWGVCWPPQAALSGFRKYQKGHRT